MAFYNLKVPIDCANENEAKQLQTQLEGFKLFSSKMVYGLMNIQRTKPKLVRSVMNAAATGNISSAFGSIMKAL